MDFTHDGTASPETILGRLFSDQLGGFLREASRPFMSCSVEILKTSNQHEAFELSTALEAKKLLRSHEVEAIRGLLRLLLCFFIIFYLFFPMLLLCQDSREPIA